jgi:putative flippase GtrA
MHLKIMWIIGIINIYAYERMFQMEKLIKAFVGIFPKKIQDIYYKYEEKWLYLVFGVLTTVVSIVTKLAFFGLVPGEPKWETTAGVVFSWVCAVTFAFFTNKKYVFKNETNGRKEFFAVFVSFYGARLATLAMEWVIFFVFCDILHISKSIITFASQVIIFVANYLLSKLFVFKKKDENKSNG